MLHYTIAILRCDAALMDAECILTLSLLAATLTSANCLGPDQGGIALKKRLIKNRQQMTSKA